MQDEAIFIWEGFHIPLALTHDSTKPPLQGRRLYFMLFWNPALCDIGPMVDGWGQLEIMISGGEMKFGRGVGDGLGMSAGHYCSLRGWTLDIYHITPTNTLINTLIMDWGMSEGWAARCFCRVGV